MSFKMFDDRSTTTDLNGPTIEIKTDAYGHEEGSTTSKTSVNPFGSDNGRTGGTIEITGIGTASWPTGFSTYASNTGTIGYQWYELNAGALGISTRYAGAGTSSLTISHALSPEDDGNQYYNRISFNPDNVSAGGTSGGSINGFVDTTPVSISVAPE